MVLVAYEVSQTTVTNGVSTPKNNVAVEMLQGNGTYWIFYGGQIYQSDNPSELLQQAQIYFQENHQP